ncbi:MAG: K(+)-transporting ATPase subunit F [Candidatus Omnitrophica bacterium]|nr:K(+)-transporting ATPase subunit F [Candidatus Omnitrophota bacterium]
MVIIYWVGGIIAFGLFAYLLVALFNPEMFS